MNDSQYCALPLKEKVKDTFYNFFMVRWLLAREAAGMESDHGYVPVIKGLRMNDMAFDEDVNVYVSGLLANAAGSAGFHQKLARYVRDTELGIHRLAGESSDRAFKFMVYRTNADHIFLRLGIFDHFREDFGSSYAQLTRGKRYYAFAAGYLGEINRGRSALQDVIEKMSVRLDDYYEILSTMTRKYLEFVQRISPSDEAGIQRGIKRAVDGMRQAGNDCGRTL